MIRIPGIKHLVVFTLFFLAVPCNSQNDGRGFRNFIRLQPGEPLDSIVLKASHITPSSRQVAWQEMEFVVFIHFGMNTFTDREWGIKNEDPSKFNPTALDARQWVRTAKMAGAGLLVMVAKHHDGFCLWPTAFSDYSVKKSPWKKGKGDVIAEVAEACKEYGLKMGIYLSPWDISSPIYGTPAYNDHFKSQLRELLSNYGEISEVWFDGACGEGPNGKKQVYDWPGYYKLIRELQPWAVIAVMGPDVRWVGTESGCGRETEWSVVPVSDTVMYEIEKSSAQSVSNMAFYPQINVQQQDLGSIKKLMDASGLAWYPSEVDVSVRPGWFYHQQEDTLVKSAEELVDIYFGSVGRNSVLLLNLPPDRRGLIHENDVQSLKGMRKILDATFDTNLAENAIITTDPFVTGRFPSAMTDDSDWTFWSPGSGIKACNAEFDLGDSCLFNRLMLQENFRNGQRVEEFVVEVLSNGRWKEITRGTTIGYKRLLRFESVTASVIRLRIFSSREMPEISTFGVYKEP